MPSELCGARPGEGPEDLGTPRGKKLAPPSFDARSGKVSGDTLSELEMDQKSRDVLDAAERWLLAAHAKTTADGEQPTADGEQRPDGSEQAELDAAEVDLATAIMVWRNAGRPD